MSTVIAAGKPARKRAVGRLARDRGSRPFLQRLADRAEDDGDRVRAAAGGRRGRRRRRRSAPAACTSAGTSCRERPIPGKRPSADA